jgi:transposase|tara:strand:+ start:112 stop:1662 length:1551 start_codon:yes stop_codon:yes gene_type:complete
MARSTIHLLQKRGRSQRQIAAELGLSRTTVARVLQEPVAKPPRRRKQRASIVDPYRPQIVQWVREGLSGVRMLELARADPRRPYRGGHSVFRTAVRQERLAQAQASAVAQVPVRFEGLPGEYLQVDWGEVRRFPFTGQPVGTRYFLACRLKYSRWNWVRFTTDMRQETLLRGLVDCCVALRWVPWVLVFDNMKTVTSGRDAQGQPVWHPAFRQLAVELGFHPEACHTGAANQKGSVEALVKWVKGNFLAGRQFADEADLAQQCRAWLAHSNARPSQATGEAPNARLAAEAAQGGPLPPTARDYGFLHPARVSAEALVAVRGNQYSVPLQHVGAPVTVRVHRARLALWRDTTLIAAHARAPDGAQQRVVEPTHFAPLFARKPRAQLMLYRQVLLQLGAEAAHYLREVSRRQRACLREEVLGIYALYEQWGTPALLAAMAVATRREAYSLAALRGLLTAPAREQPAVLAQLPPQAAIDRPLQRYEAYVQGAGAPTAPRGATGPPEPVGSALVVSGGGR